MRELMPGKVYLVGAGSGDPELLTLKALRVLREADIVLHDDLISEQILKLIPRTATTMSVGKRCGAARVTQEEINTMLIAYARSGRTVVRLKSGDPMLFGRAGEEIDALRRGGIEMEIVPGISAAFAAAAALKVSLTDRRKASRVVFTTGHRAPGADQKPDHAHSREGYACARGLAGEHVQAGVRQAHLRHHGAQHADPLQGRRSVRGRDRHRSAAAGL